MKRQSKLPKKLPPTPKLDDETLMEIITSLQLRMDSLALDIEAYKTLQAKTETGNRIRRISLC